MGWRYFSKETDPRLFICSETGTEGIKDEFVDLLDDLRHRCQFPLHVNSGYRSPFHSAETGGDGKPGRHTEGIAADVRYADGVQMYAILKHALDLGFTGIGVYPGRIHLDTRSGQPVGWHVSE